MNRIDGYFRKTGVVMAAAFLLAMSSCLPLCGAGSTPVENLLPQGTMQGDLNAGGHNVTNAGTVRAANVVVSGSFVSPSNVPLLLGPANANFIVMGDSITAGPIGLPQFASQSYTATMQYLGMGETGALAYDLGMRSEKTGDMLGQYYGATSTTPVTTTITTTGGGTVATIGTATGVSAGMSIGASTLAPDTLVLGISGTSVTLSRAATASGSGTTCSIATPVADLIFPSDMYPGGAANGWTTFHGTAHQLSNAISGRPTFLFLLVGTNDMAAIGPSSVTMTSTSGSPNVTITSGAYSGFQNGDVITGGNLPSSPPPWVVSGAGTANLVLSSNATASGSFSAADWTPITPFSSVKSSYSSLISDAHSDGDTVGNSGGVIAMTLLPRGSTSNFTDVVTNVFLGEFNTWLKTSSGADYVFDTNSALPPFGSIAGSPYYYTDDLHLTPLGTALLGRYIDQQFFGQVMTTALAWNPFAAGMMPDAWLSPNIPRFNQAAVFQPWQNCVSTTVSITSGSASGTITGPAAGIFPGMYAYTPGLVAGFQPGVTAVSSLSGTAITFSKTMTATNANATVFFSWSPFAGAANVQGDLIVGAANNLSAPQGNIVFLENADVLAPGLHWVNTSVADEWSITAPTSGSGDFYIQDASGNAKIDLNSGGSITTTGNLTSNGAATVDNDLTLSTSNGPPQLTITSGHVYGAQISFNATSSGARQITFGATGSGNTPGYLVAYDNTSNKNVWATSGNGGSELHPSGANLVWSSTSDALGTADTGLKRSAAGVLTVTNGGTGAGAIAFANASGGVSYTAKPGTNFFLGSTTGQTVTLPSPAQGGEFVFFKNQASVPVTLASASGSQIIPTGATSAAASVTVSSGSDALLWSDGTYWNQE